MTVVGELEDTIRTLVEQVGPSVVGLGRGRGFGSGIVIGPGRVLTSAHNLRRDEVGLTFADGRHAEASVSGADPDSDIAVLAADTGDLPAVEWREAAVEIGTPIFAFANPGGRGLRASFGIVASIGRAFRGPRGRRVTGGIEHTAPLPRGSSGGPLLDASGRLVGINTLRLEGGLILALAADGDVRERAEALGRGEAAPRPTLGIAIAPPRAARRLRGAVGLPEREGVLVRRVVNGTPAHRAGIERGDLIVAAGGRPIERLDDLFEAVDSSGGARLTLDVVRGTEERRVEVDLAATD